MQQDGMQDIQLWKRFREGDKSALETMYNQHIDYLLYYGKRLTWRVEVIEDCIHDLFVEIWARKEKLGDTDSIRAYLTASLRHSIIRKIKTDNKEKTADDGLVEISDFSLSALEDITREETIRQRGQRIQHAISQLSPKQKEIIFHRYYGGMDYDEICEIMGMPYQTARNLLHRSLQKLRSVLSSCLPWMAIILLWLSTNIAMSPYT